MSARSATRAAGVLLARQTEMLKRGNLADLAAMAPALEQSLAALAAVRPGPDDLADLAALRDMAARTTPLVAAALAGVRSARETLGVSKARGFTGYDALGRAARIGSTDSNVERRS